MGEGCDQNPNYPDYTNPCTDNDYLGQTLIIPNLCVDPSTGNSECAKIGPGWVYDSSANCPCSGAEIKCRRAKFGGDQTTCCLKNFEETRVNSNCYSDSNKKNTCDPSFRGPTLSGCRKKFLAMCVHIDPKQYSSAWNTTDQFCSRMIEGNIFTRTGDINPEGLSWAQGEMKTVLSNFFSSQEGIRPVGTAQSFQEYLYRFCSDTPQACETGLTSICSEYSREAASGNPNVVNFCGCHMIPSVYAVYANQYAIGKECDPLCARTSTVPFSNSQGQIQSCQSSICIIDDVTLNLTDTDVGNINFYQACGGCSGSASCRCSISGITITAAEAELGEIDFNQVCTGEITCYLPNPDNPEGPDIRVDCGTEQPVPPSETEREVEESTRTALIVILSALGLLVIVLGFVLILAASKKTPAPIVETEYVVQSDGKSGNKVS